jgi:hypothetical protein
LTENNEEPVAYLGGKAAEPEAPVEGYLGGDAPPDSLPSLPPAGVSAVYSASDFIAAPAEEEAAPAYDSYAAEPPVEAPQADQSDFEQYGHPEGEPQHPAEMDNGTATVVEQPQEASSDFDDPGLPKTISQQDAENIIKRITTKKILPPEVAAQEGVRVNPSSELTPRGSPKLGRMLIVLVLLIGGAAALVFFKDDVGPYLPEVIQNLIGYVPPPPTPVIEPSTGDTPEMKKQKALREKVLESEWRAFGYASKQEMLDANKPATPPPGDTPPPGTTPTEPPK